MAEIVVGYDGSEGAKAALDKAVEFAKELGDRIVIVFGYAPGGYGGGEVPTHREAVKELGDKMTKEANERVSAAGVEHEVQLINERGAEALSDVATQREARMIVVGSYGESPLTGAVLGRTAYRLVHVAERPVLVVRA
ncbi:MAG: universal stress protein [Solirubrobacterales bacterium]